MLGVCALLVACLLYATLAVRFDLSLLRLWNARAAIRLRRSWWWRAFADRLGPLLPDIGRCAVCCFYLNVTITEVEYHQA